MDGWMNVKNYDNKFYNELGVGYTHKVIEHCNTEIQPQQEMSNLPRKNTHGVEVL